MPAGSIVPSDRNAEKRLRLMFDGLGPSMFVGLMTPDGVLVEANRSALAAAGVKLEDVLGVPFETTAWWTWSPPIQKQLRAAINRAALGEASRYDVQVRGANSSLIDVDFSLEPLRGEDGKVAFLVPSAIVITERKRVESALRDTTAQFEQRERMLSTTLSSINDLAYIFDRNGRFVFANRPLLDLWGLTLEGAIGKNFLDLGYPPELVATLGGQVQVVFDTNTGLTGEVAYTSPTGVAGLYEYTFSPVPGADGEVEFVAGSGRDVSERNRSIEALRASVEEFRSLADAVPQIVWVTRPDGWVMYTNKRWTEYTGQSMEDSLGRGWNTAFHPDDQQRSWDAWQAAVATGGLYETESRIRRADGAYRWCISRGVPQKDAGGEIVNWFGTSTDVHDLKFAQLEISRTNRALQMLSASNETLIRAEREKDLLNAVCNIAVVTGGYRMAWVGYALDDATRSVTPMAHSGFEDGHLTEFPVNWDEHNPFGRGPVGLSIRSGRAETCVCATDLRASPWAEAALKRGYGSVISLPLRDSIRTFGVLCLHSADIDVPNEKELKLLQDMADNLAYGIVTLRARIERKALASQLMVSDRMASMGTLAAGVAHEINNPLAAVVANLDYIADSVARMAPHASATPVAGHDDAWIRNEITGPLDDARYAAQRVRFIVRDLMVFSRTPRDEAAMPVNIQASLESTLRMAGNEIRHRASLVTEFAAIPDVMGNEARLGQVFLNLIVNAAQSLPEGHADINEIRVTTRAQGERVIVEVSDTGPGIAPEIVGRVFDAFFTTKEVGAGTGLGLAICQRIITDMGGALTVESIVGSGTTFRVSLPAAQLAVVERVAVDEPVLVPGRRGHILVVDDDALVARAVTRMLSTDHDVVSCIAARDALALIIAGESFDLILCDLMMPDMTGMELYREIAMRAPAQAAKIVVLTGGAFTETAQQFLSSTTLEQMDKPFNSAKLRALVRRFVQ